MDALLDSVLPPAVPSLINARALVHQLPSCSPLPPISRIYPALKVLCEHDGPTPLQMAGFDILAAYFEHAEANILSMGTSDRMVCLSFFSGDGKWNRELWEPKFKALRAFTRWGGEMIGIGEDVVKLLKDWISDAFSGFDDNENHDNNAERERSIKILAGFLNAVVTNPSVLARMAQLEETGGALDLYGGLIDSRSSSGNSVLAFELYLSHLHSQLSTLRPQHLQTILPLLFRALARCATPLPRLTVTSANSSSSSGINHERRITDMLQSLFTGPYPSTCTQILVKCLSPSSTSVETPIGALRALRSLIRRALSTRLARVYISSQSSTAYTHTGAPSHITDIRRDIMERAWPGPAASISSISPSTISLSTSTGGAGWDPARWARPLRESAKSWVELGSQPLGVSDVSEKEIRERVLEELAGIVKDVLQELDLREEYEDTPASSFSSPYFKKDLLDQDEASAVGGLLSELSRYLDTIASPTPFVLPLTSPSSAPTPFLKNLSALLARDFPLSYSPPTSSSSSRRHSSSHPSTPAMSTHSLHNMAANPSTTTPLNPPLTTILLNLAASQHLSDSDIARLVVLMKTQGELDGIERWPAVLSLYSTPSISRNLPRTKRTTMQALKEIYDSVKDMPFYRRRLGGLVLRILSGETLLSSSEHETKGFIQGRTPKGLETETTLWKIIGEEVVLRCAEAEGGGVPGLEIDEGEIIEEDSKLDSFLDILVDAASKPIIEDEEEVAIEKTDDEHLAASDRDVATPTPATISLNRVQSRQHGHQDEETLPPAPLSASSQLPSVISLFSSLSGSVTGEMSFSGGRRRNRSASTSMSAVSMRGVAIDPPVEHTYLPNFPPNLADQELQQESPEPTVPTNLIAVKTLIGIFIKVGFTPGYGYYDCSVTEDARRLSIPITIKTLYAIHSALLSILSPSSCQTSTRVRLAILQFYVRLRADRDHRLYLSSDPDKDGNGQVRMLSNLIGRVGVDPNLSGHSANLDSNRIKDDGTSGAIEDDREVDASWNISGTDNPNAGQGEADAVSELRRARARDAVRERRGSRWGSSNSGSGSGGRQISTSTSRSPSRSRLRRATAATGNLGISRELRETIVPREWREHPPPQTARKQGKEKEKEKEPHILLWSCPERLDFLDGARGLSGLLRSYDFNFSPPEHTVPVFPISKYLATVLEMLSASANCSERSETNAPQRCNWEPLSYLLVHLPTQLSNKHLFCGPLSRQILSKILTCLCTGISSGKLGMAELQTTSPEPSFYPTTLKARDAHSLAYSTLSVLISYRFSFELKHQHLLVETLLGGLSSTKPHTITSCLHALSLCAYELQSSLTKFLKDILEKLSQIMSTGELGGAGIAVHVLAFLSIVGDNGEKLTGNFTEREFKLIFGVALKYLQGHNRMIRSRKSDENSGTSNPDSKTKSQVTISWALSQHVRILSYHLVYTWFLALRLPDRPKHVRYITHQLLLANEGNEEVDDPTEVAFDWLARYSFASADPRPAGNSILAQVTTGGTPSSNNARNEDAGGNGNPSGRHTDAPSTSTKSWLQGNSVVTISTLPRSGWVEVLCRRPSGYTKFLARVENVPMVGVGEVNPSWIDIPAAVLMDRDAGERKAGRPDVGYEDDGTPREDITSVMPKSSQEGDDSLRPDPITGYVWSKTAPSQRRKDVSVDPAFLALQLSPYPVHLVSGNIRMLVEPSLASRFCNSIDRIPVIDTHKVGILYVAPGQTTEVEILRNSHGSPAYTRFLEGIGRLINLRGQIDVYAGGLDPDEDGEYAYAWWDDIYQILYHTATLMPTHAHDEQCVFKKRHIGNDFVRIVWNDSGLPYRFDTLQTQFQFVNIVIEPHSLGAMAAFSNNVHENEYFKVTVQRAEGMMEFTPVGEFKLISAENLSGLVRQLSLLSDWFAFVFSKTERDTVQEEIRTNWAERLGAIRRLRKQTESKAAEGNGSATTNPNAGDDPRTSNGDAQNHILAQESFRDFTTAF